MTLEQILRNEVELLITKWEGGGALVSAGKIADIAQEIAQRKNDAAKAITR